MKKFLSLLLALTFVFALVACSNEKDATSEPDTSMPSPTEVELPDNTEIDTSGKSSFTTETQSNDTPTTSTETSKPTTSNKDNTTSSKPTDTTSNKDNTTSSKPSASTASKPTTSKEPTLPSNEHWSYKNGGYDYIIKYRGDESVRIQLDMSKLPPEIKTDANGITKNSIERYNFICSDNYIFFCQIIYSEYTNTNPNVDGVIGYFPREYICKIKTNGTEYTEIGVPDSQFGHRFMLGEKDGYMYCMLGQSWAPYGDVYKIKISDSLCNITDSYEYVFDGEKLFFEYFGNIIKSNIIGDFVYYTVDIEEQGKFDYRIKIDGTQLEKIN